MSQDTAVIVKTYRGTQKPATRLFKEDAVKMAERGYVPTSQSFAQGSYGCGAFLVALILCLLLIGIVIFIYMVLVKPDGTLSVTYELRPHAESADEKTCPRCAELVKAGAVVCRFCGHEFAGQPGV